MANAMYPSFKESLLAGTYDISSATADAPSVSLIDTNDYTYSAAHDFYDDISGVAGAEVATVALTKGSITITSGAYDAPDATWSAVSGDPSEAFILYSNTGGADSTDPLILYVDTSITGSPVTPNGGDIVLQFNGSGIFTL